MPDLRSLGFITFIANQFPYFYEETTVQGQFQSLTDVV